MGQLVEQRSSADACQAAAPRTETPGWRGAGAYVTRSVPLVSVAVGVAVWETLARTSTLPVFVSLLEVGEAAVAMTEDGLLARHVAGSGTSFLLGYTLAVIVGVLVGISLGLSPLLRRTFEPWLYAFYSIPIVAIAPIFIIAFGIGIVGHIVVVFALTVFAVTVNTITGIATADEQYVEVARAYNGSRADIVRYVLIPSAIPFILTGMRLGVTRALIGVVVAELFGARAGVGYMILQAQQRFDTADMYVGIVILAAAGIVSTKLLARVERRLNRWRPDRQL